MQNVYYDSIIIGAGPAGLTAAIYLQRAGLRVKLLEKLTAGGQAALTHEVENYPAVASVSGFDLCLRMLQQAEQFGAKLDYEEVTQLLLDQEATRAKGGRLPLHRVKTTEGEYITRSIILAVGTSPMKLGVAGEDLPGVSYCATCDGGFYRNKRVLVVGGGNTALEDSLYLEKIAKQVHLMHRRDAYRADRIYVERLHSADISELLSAQVKEIQGKDHVTGVLYEQNGERKQLDVDGIFVAIGLKPNSALYDGLLETKNGFIVTDENMLTSVRGVYAAGDIRVKSLRQIVTATADGAIAADSVVKYLMQQD